MVIRNPEDKEFYTSSLQLLRSSDAWKMLMGKLKKRKAEITDKVMTNFSGNHNKKWYTRSDIEKVKALIIGLFMELPDDILEQLDVRIQNAFPGEDDDDEDEDDNI